MTAATAITASQTAEYVNPLIAATRTVFETMLGCTPKRVKLALKDTLEPQYDLSAVIGITGRANGTIVLSLSEAAALEVLNRMLGIEVTEINADVCDAVGELTKLMKNSEAKVRGMATIALGYVGSPERINALSRCYENISFRNRFGGWRVLYGISRIL